MSLVLPRRAALFGAAACPFCPAIAADNTHTAPPPGSSAATHAPHWGYTGDNGPEKWGSLRPDFRVCDLGLEQTPIDLASAIRAQTGAVRPAFREMPLTLRNNGHTIQIDCPPGSQTEIDGVRYDLAQFHFHHPSEHVLSGQRFELELHFVHRSAAGALAVLGVFLKPGAPNRALEPIFAAMPAAEGPPRDAGVTIGPAGLLPAGAGYFRYAGSLTTPPCSEGVLWTVFKDPIEASPEQIRRFATLFPGNARPIQGVNRRFLLESL